MTKTISIYSCSSDDYMQFIYEKLGRGKQHARKIYSNWMRYGKISLDVETQAISLVKEIVSHTDFSIPESPVNRKANGDTKKFLLRFSDNLESESIILPMHAGITLCVSSQVGCRMGCAFCETGKMGLLRHLSAEEIVSQMFYANTVLGSTVKNIVFMGMGEPFDNFANVKKAVEILCDPYGFSLGSSRITISTSGDVEAIKRFTEEFDPAINLAVSVNASNDEVRSRLMPINRKWNMEALKKSLLAYCENPRRTIFAEYVLLKGINDSHVHAKELAHYLKDLRVKINVIPYNPQSKDRFSAPEEQEIHEFISSLREEGYQVLMRNNKGRDIMGACGQLGNKEQRQRMFAQGSLPIL